MRIFSIIFIFTFGLIFSKEKNPDSYEQLMKKYENYEEDDARAFQYVNLYIGKAKKENRVDKLFQGYRDAVSFSRSWIQKLKYADSCIDAAYKSADNDRIATAYILKGSVYYANFKKYKPALDEYLMAYKYSRNTTDLYLKYKIFYHLGVVKNYLGYHEEAIDLFNDCLGFFEKEANNPKLHPFEVFNNKKGYLNTLHQLIVCYQNLKLNKKSDSLIDIGLLKTFNNKDFLLERSYFLKSKGISEYQNKRYQQSVEYLKQSLPGIREINDFAWLSVDYFYMGKSNMAMNNDDIAISNFKKIDSIFSKHNFILPELRENYELLINYYKQKKDSENQLYYTTQLLKADSIISKDFAALSLKIHREYDTNTLLEEKGKLEKENSQNLIMISVLAVIAISLVIILLKRYKSEKEIFRKYILLEERLRTHSYSNIENKVEAVVCDDKKMHINESIRQDLLKKLTVFEEKKQFIQKSLTIQKLAVQLDTNSNYLSHVINECKGMNFNKYLSELRIRYITRLLFEKNLYLNYTIDSLAKECGIASRQNFSDLFYEINGIRPTDFIRKRKKELENLEYSSLNPI